MSLAADPNRSIHHAGRGPMDFSKLRNMNSTLLMTWIRGGRCSRDGPARPWLTFNKGAVGYLSLNVAHGEQNTIPEDLSSTVHYELVNLLI